MLKAFKEFLNRGNVIDLAVAVVIGAAFNQIVNSLVQDIFTPLIGILLGGLDFVKNLSFSIGNATIKYGAFIQAIFNFIITAFALFLIVQAYNRFKNAQDVKEAVAKEVKPGPEVVLLTQIRDILDKNNGSGPTGTAAPVTPTPPPETQATR